MKWSEWLLRLLGVHGTAREQKVQSIKARQELLAAIETLRRDLHERNH